MFSLKSLRITGYIEGTSMLLLLFLAMPVKYYLGEPLLVRYIGSAHGLLFIWYTLVLALTAKRIPLPWWSFPLGFMGAVLPFGPFIFEYILKKYSPA